jgi:hypothetical protein
MPTTNSSQNTNHGHGQHSLAGDNSESDDPGSRFYKRKISALEETLNRREEDRRAKKRSVSMFPEDQ